MERKRLQDVTVAVAWSDKIGDDPLPRHGDEQGGARAAFQSQLESSYENATRL